MNNEITNIILKLVKAQKITPEEGAQLIKGITSLKNENIQDIAVVGVSGKFPDAQNVEEFWTNLAAGKDSVAEIPESRWSTEQFYDPDPEVPNKSYSRWAGLLSDIDRFDPAFFKISPREAELMDPQQRLFLQEAWGAFENAGYSPEELDNKKCGVFVGCSTGDYQYLFPENQIFPQAYSVLGNVTSVLAARVSYLLNLKGPSIAIDTACSSSLVAVHLACESIRSGTSDIALAGGVMVYSTPFNFIWASKLGILSPQGKCKTFDQAADGIAISECAAAVILKPLKTALEAGDHIWGVIKGSGINQDGNTDPGITAPSASAQAELETEIYQKYHINPETISYVEAHGTGTKLGDPIEIDGLTQAFRKHTQKKQYCAIGSVKTNIGHAQIAAGIAGFIKLLLCLKHKKLIPSLHLEKENKYLNLPDTPFYVNTQLRDWKTVSGIPRRGALSSLGFSGTNAHLVLEEYTLQESSTEVINTEPQLIVLSAANKDRLKAYAKNISDFLNTAITKADESFSMADFAYTLQVGRNAMIERLAIVAENPEEVIEKLTQYIEGKVNIPNLYCGHVEQRQIHSAPPHIDEIIRDKKLEEIASLWVTGTNIDWLLLYQGQKKQRLPLPAYPFAKKRFWVPINDAQPQAEITIEPPRHQSTTEPTPLYYYQTLWESVALNTLSTAFASTNVVLLFDLDDAHYASVKTTFKCDVILVIPTEAYQKLNHQTYGINPNQPADYHQLLTDLNREPSHIIHLWSQSRFYSATLNAQLKMSLFAIFYLTQALLALKPKKPIQLLYAYLANSVASQPHYAALSGFAKTIHQENTHLFCKTVALSDLEAIGEIALAEFQSSAGQVYYEKGQRWVKRIQQVDGNREEFIQIVLKEKGVYLITGGLGGLGLVFAEYLAKHFKATLILNGRSRLSREQREKINRLKAFGADVYYKQADISKRAEVEALITTIKSEFNMLNGIIHSAGVIKNALISKKSTEEINTVLAPKVYGTTYLDEITQNEPLDFFILFSSVIAMMDNIGQGDYAYANAFMDNFAENREQLRITQKRSGKTLSINWPLWQKGGMQVDQQTEKWLADAMGMYAISNQTGLNAFLYGLAFEKSQLIVVNGDQEKIERSLGFNIATLPSINQTATVFAEDNGLPSEEVTFVTDIVEVETISFAQLQQDLLTIIAENLKINKADINLEEDISNYGADSIIAIMIVNQINQKYDLELSATLFFDYPSINEFVQFLSTEYPERFYGKVEKDELPIEGTPLLETIPLAQLQQDLCTIVATNLKVDEAEINLEEDISNYGADSIIAIMIVNQINQKYDLELSATLFFDYPSITELAKFLCEAYPDRFSISEENRIDSITPPVTELFLENETQKNISTQEKVIFSEEFPLSYDQQAQWFSQQKTDQATSAYNLSILHRICSPLNVEVLRQSFQFLIERHSLLRAVFTMQAGQLVQKIRQQQTVAFKTVDASGWSEELLRQRVIEADHIPFDLAQDALFRVHLFTRTSQDHILLITVHHIIFDGWSGAIVMDELSKIYPSLLAGQTPDLPSLPYSYKDYVQWYADLLASPKAEIQWQYWQHQLAGELPVLQLPTDYPRSPLQPLKGTFYSFQLEENLIQQLKKLAHDEGVTLFSLLLAAFYMLLYDYSGQEDIIVGSPFANRNHHKLTSIVGDLVNMVALRNYCDRDIEFTTFLGQVKNTVQEALKYSEYPFQLLVQRLKPKRVLGYSPVFQSVFVLQKPLSENSPWQTMDPTVTEFTWAGLEIQPFIIPTGAGRFDLQLEIVELENTLVSWFNYNTGLFNEDTIAKMAEHFTSLLQAIVQNPKQPIKALQAMVAGEENITETTVQTLAITATFTAEPLRETLDFWVKQLEIPAKITFAPYHQVFQQLLDPASLLANNRQGFNIILMRFEDWVDRGEREIASQSPTFSSKIEKNLQDLALTLKSAVQNAVVPYLLCICPASPAMAPQADFFQQMESSLEEAMRGSNNLFLVKSAELLDSYPLTEFYDPLGDKEGHVPYIPLFFTTLGTVLSRKLYALRQKPYKVIVLDCDNTLWQGVCGEDGPLGIDLSPPYQALQTFMLEQQKAGVLLCLCSKNVAEDVFAVFEKRTDMPLKREHLVAWRINWELKSENLKSLSEELQLGLDSFIFIDDNPLECAEVQANCPEVLTLQLPTDTDNISTFLRHIWAFDHLKVTSEDHQRTTFYQQNVQREQLRQQAMTLADFLNSLEIKIQITEMEPTQISRVSQMTQRTNQFNATTIRRTESDIQQLVRSGEYTCLVVDVKDRFGDYGLVGLLILTANNDTLYVDTFLVSCRVLGRGVEHTMLSKAGEIAQQRGLKGVMVGYEPTSKNKPIRNFLDRVAFKPWSEMEESFWFPVDYCQTIVYQPDIEVSDPSTQTPATSPANTSQMGQANAALLQRIATQLYDPTQILQLLESEKTEILDKQQPIITARTETETELVVLWKRVLPIQSLGIHDNFFKSGGDSLLAIKLMFYIQETFHIELSLSQLLDAPTIADLSVLIEKAIAQDTQASKNTIEINKQSTITEQDIYPLSYGQQALWFLYQSDPESAAYNVALPLRIRCEINILVLQNTFQALVNRHPCLRTTFIGGEDEPSQKVNTHQLISFEWIDVSTWSWEAIQSQVVEAYQKPFDLSNGSVLRVHLLTRSSQDHILLLTAHHIIVDGWSLWSMLGELGQLYSLIKAGHQPILPPLEYNYADFVDWQTKLLQSKGESLWTYWQEQLKGELPVLNLPTDYPRPKVQSYRGESVHFVITNPLLSQLKQLAQNEQVSLYTVLLATYQVMLYRYSGQTDILVGAPTTGRTQNAFSHIVGYFVNVVVLRAKMQNDVPFKDFLKQVQQTVISALEHQDYPFMLLVKRLQPNRDPSRSSLFQVDFAFQQLQQEEHLDFSSTDEAKLAIKAGELSLETFEMGQQEGLFDLTLDILEVKGSLVATFMYNTDLFKETTIHRMVEHFKVLLEGITTTPLQSISKLPLLTAAEQRQLLDEWNNTQIEYPENKLVHQLFEDQVARTPTAIAVIFEERQLTYTLLNTKANQLAHHLQALGITSNKVVGVCMERSLEMVVGLLGILKAGGGYLPLDPHHPTERIDLMLEDANASILLTQSTLQDKFASLNISVIALDTETILSSQLHSTNPVNKGDVEDLAYIIYTSGSTGTPKGVMLKHRGLCNHNQTIIAEYQLTPADKCLQFASLNFDVATEEIFPTLLSGATLVLLPSEGFTSFAAFQTFITDRQLTVLNLPASYWHEWILNITDTLPSSLRLIVVGSEKVSLASLKAWHKLKDRQRIKWINAYGPTEATITATLYEPITSQLIDQAITSVPIGRPIANLQVYILDSNLQLVPIGVPGELHIAGIGLAKGYLNNSSLTAEKFIANPFDQTHNTRLYKTGDLARYLPDGNIEYLERIDDQVKVRGFRIEIGEIEVTLMQHPNVQDALVKLFENKSGRYLVAYIVPTSDSRLSNEAEWHSTLENYLRAKLPDYMVPKVFMMLEVLPLTSNGKIDRNALPEPDIRRRTRYVAPLSKIEKQCALIWEAVLKQESIGIYDNFFELGGDSIRSLQIVAKAKEYGLFMKNNDIFQHQTIAQLAAVIQEDTVLEIDQGLVTGKVALIPIQHTFFARELPQPAHYNQFVWVETTQTLNIDHLRQAFTALLLHHDALRLRYRWQTGEWQQFCDSSTETIPLFVETLTDISETEQLQLIKERTEHYQASLDLESGPLLCLVVFKLGLTTRLLWCIHHLLVDGVSWRILLDDLQTAYQQLSQGMGVKLPQKTSSFKVWAENLTRYAQSKELTQQIPYWQTMLSHHFTLPVDNLSGANTLSSTQDYFVSLDKVETDVLLKEANTAYQTRINDLLLTALAHTLSAWAGQRDCLIDLESHGRVNLFKELDISRTVGWFTAIYPVQLRLPATDEWGECIRAIKKQLRQVPDEGIGYGLLYAFGQGISFPASTGQVLFNYLGQFDQTVEEGVFHPVSGKDAFGLSQSDQGERDYLLEINGAVQNGCLMFSWSYSCDVHQETTIQRLAERYLQTLRALIAHCKNILPHAQEAEASLVAAIRSAGVKLPFFCLPGMQGLPRYLYPLAHQLNIEHPFYGLYAPEIVGQPTCTSVETLATCYLSAIKTVQSQGPYQIGGHSFGAVVAFEIARQLEKANEVVSLLVLIDEPVPVREENAVTAKKNELEALVDYLKWLAYFNDFAMYDGDLSSYTPDERLELAVNFLNQAGLALDKQELQTTLRAFTNNYQCYNRYIPQGKLSRSRVVLLQSSEKELAHKEPSLGWQQYVTQPIEVYKVAGGHFTMFANPYVKTMAEIMSDILA